MGERPLRAGTVVDFDEHRGLGTVQDTSGERYPFHCTQLADGTRSIPVGTAVRFAVRAGGLGRWEAAAIERT